MASKTMFLLLFISLLVTSRVSSQDEQLKTKVFIWKLVAYAKVVVPSPAPPAKPPPSAPSVKPPVSAPPVKSPPYPSAKPPLAPPTTTPMPPVRSIKDCIPLCKNRCQNHSRGNLCMRACTTCCDRCKCVPPGTFGNREICGKCYTDMRTHGNKPKCP